MSAGALRVQPRVDGVVVWRAPTAWDVLAYALPATFCLLATLGGAALVAHFHPRYLLLAVPSALCLAAFLVAGVRAVQRVRVSPAGIVLPRGGLVPSAAVINIAAQPGPDDARAGVAIHSAHGTHIVLLGLAEKDRVVAAAALAEAVALHSRSDSDVDANCSVPSPHVHDALPSFLSNSPGRAV